MSHHILFSSLQRPSAMALPPTLPCPDTASALPPGVMEALHSIPGGQVGRRSGVKNEELSFLFLRPRNSDGLQEKSSPRPCGQNQDQDLPAGVNVIDRAVAPTARPASRPLCPRPGPQAAHSTGWGLAEGCFVPLDANKHMREAYQSLSSR